VVTTDHRQVVWAGVPVVGTIGDGTTDGTTGALRNVTLALTDVTEILLIGGTWIAGMDSLQEIETMTAVTVISTEGYAIATTIDRRHVIVIVISIVARC